MNPIIKNSLKHVFYPLMNMFSNRGIWKLILTGKVKIGLSRLIDCNFSIYGEGSIVVGDGCVLRGLSCLVYDSTIRIGNDVHINASKHFPTIFNAFNGTRLVIGDNCLFSNSVELHTTDYHSVVSQGERINPSKSIMIDNHVWVGLRSIILKGTHIASDNVVGAGSVVAKSFEESNSIICGNPANVVKTNINWDIRDLQIKESDD